MSTYLDDLAASGYLGLPFTWTADGTCWFDDSIGAEDQDAIVAIFAAHPDEQPFVIGPPPAALVAATAPPPPPKPPTMIPEALLPAPPHR